MSTPSLLFSLLLLGVLIFLNLHFHGIHTVGNSLFEGVSLLRDEERLAGQCKLQLGNLVIIAFRFVNLEYHFALGGVVYHSVKLRHFFVDKLFSSALNLTALMVVFIISSFFIG